MFINFSSFYKQIKERRKIMQIEEIRKKVLTPETEYRFLEENEHLGSNIILLGLGGSHAYGTNKEGSDLDIRGIALNSSKEILLGKDFAQVVNTDTDTTIYSFNKILELLTSCNPNTIEMLGLEDWQYIKLHPIGEELLKNKKMFLSKLCITTFLGYAASQLRRLENKTARLASQAQQEAHILKSIENARYSFKEKYLTHEDDIIKLYIDKTIQEDYETEIFMDINLSRYPLRDWVNMWNEMKSIVSSYNKIGKRNEKAISHDKLGKHMAHLIRLYMMGIDILEKEEIITYRREEHELLMAIRNGKFLDDNRQPITEFYEILNEYEKRFEYAKENTSLPDLPDKKQIEEFKMYVNEKIIKGDI